MRVSIIVAAAASVIVAGCATTAPTSWGKAGVSKLQYRTDAAECALAAAMQQTDAGSIGDRVQTGPAGERTGGQQAPGSDSTQASTSTATTPAGGSYRSMGVEEANAYGDAARLQAAMARKEASRARGQAVDGCLQSRGYRQFRLTSEQAATLKTLPEGSDERRNFLYGLGSDPAVLNAQGL